MAAWCAGEGRAFDLLVARFGPEVHGFLRRQLGDSQQAEDAWSETWIRVVRNRDRYQGSGQFRAWLFSIARRCAMDSSRGRRRWLNLARRVFSHRDAAAAPSPELRVLGDERDEAVLAAVLELPAEHRAVVLLTYQQGLDSAEVGRALDLTPQQVRSRLTYARQRLRASLEP